MDAKSEQRNKKKDKSKRNRGFPYKRLKLREEIFKDGTGKK